MLCTLRTRPLAHASRSRCPLHRKRESQRILHIIQALDDIFGVTKSRIPWGSFFFEAFFVEHFYQSLTRDWSLAAT